MKILDKYFIRLMLAYSFYSISILTLIFSFFKFLEELRQLNNTNYTIDLVVNHTLLSIPSIIGTVLVLGLMIGAVFTFGSLNSNKEVQIFHTGGISQKNLIIKIIKYSFFMSLFLIIIIELFAPKSLKLAEKIKDKATGRYVTDNSQNIWIKNKDNFIFLSGIDKKNKKGELSIFTLDRNKGLIGYIFDSNSKIEENEIVYSNNGININSENEYLNFSMLDSKDKKKVFSLNELQIELLNTDLKTLNLIELTKLFISSIKNNTNYKEYYFEITSRLTQPFILVGMILISIPYILNLSRAVSIANRLFIAISIGIITHLIARLVTTLVSQYSSLTIIGPYITVLILFVFGLALLRLKKMI